MTNKISTLSPHDEKPARQPNPVLLELASAQKSRGKTGQQVWRRLRRNPAALVGLVILVIFIALVLTAPWLARYSPTEIDLEVKLQSPSLEHWLGTDNLGRDIFSRLLYGGRVSLGTSGLVTAVVLLIGAVVGATAGFFGGWLDDLVSGLANILLALPGLTLALALAGMLGPGLTSIILAMIPLSWVGYARIFRSLVLSVREEEYITAAAACGVPVWRILFRHVMPNIIGPIIVAVSLDLGGILLAISSLSFLGLGIQPPNPEWGAMLNDGRTYIESAPHLMLYPGLAILLTVLACNLVGDALRDAFDPHQTSH